MTPAGEVPVRADEAAVYAAAVATLVICINLWIVKMAHRAAVKKSSAFLTRWFGRQ